ncbi:MAG TPA: AI-2E family transporter [Candidatus Nanoarchaeia archaeon]|nr:AI-2E family transporter [Candidatus Nanoarchaeia archaeon]
MEEELDVKKHSRYIFLVMFILLLALSLYLLSPYLIALVSAMILTYIFYPLYSWVNRFIKNRDLSAFLLSALLILAITLPLLFAANTVVNESVQIFHRFNNIDLGIFADKISEYFGGNVDLNFYIKELLNKFSVSIAQQTSEFLLSLPSKLIVVFVMLFTMFYMFKDGKEWIQQLKDDFPLKTHYKENLARKFDSIIYAVLYGVVITAVIQGAVGALGLWIFNVNSPIIWGIVMTIFAMLPFVGPYLIWIPAAIIKLAEGDINNGIGLFLYGILIVSTIDNVLRPKLISQKAQIHPVIVLLGVLGGLKIFGLIGIIIGPLILAIASVFIELYILEKKQGFETTNR